MPAGSPEELHGALAAALNAGDRNAYVDLHEDAAVVLMPPSGRRARGRDAILAAVRPVLDLGPTVRCEVIAKLEVDDLALTHDRWSLVGSARGEHVEMHGRGTIVSRRQPDGSWRVVFDNPLNPS